MVWTLTPEVAHALTVMHRESSNAESTGAGGADPLAGLVTAAFRLPWHSVEYLFSRIVKHAATTPANGAARDWSWVSTEIEFRVRAVGGLASLPDAGTGDVPPPVAQIDAGSVASFPLQLKHADAYLGAALNGSSRLPSSLLAGGLAVLGLAPAGAGQGGGRGRTALVGDAAHSIHPLAGQGLNLGLADARSLVRVLSSAVRSGADLGSYNALAGYPRERYVRNQAMLSAVDHLHWLYAAPPPKSLGWQDTRSSGEGQGGILRSVMSETASQALVWARSTGVEVVNEIAPLKAAFMRQAGAGSTKTTGGR